MTWQNNLIQDTAGLKNLLADVHTVAVLGIRSEKCAQLPTHYVPKALADAGITIIPVPVYEPNATHILGQQVYRTLAHIPDPVDLVNVFRRPEDIPGHLNDILALKPKAVWFQSGIRHDVAARTLAEAGIQVVQDRCLMVDYRNLGPT